MRRLISILVALFLIVANCLASTVSLAWDPSDTLGVTYNVYRSTVSGMYMMPLNITPIAGLAFDDISVTPGNYYYVVRAVLPAIGESANSNEVQAVISTVVVLAPPTGLKAMCSASASTVVLTWDSLANAQSYYIRMENVSDTNDMPIYADGYQGTSVSSVIKPDVSYDFYVHGYNSSAGVFNPAWGPGIGPDSHLLFSCPLTPPPPVTDKLAPTL